MPSKEKALDIEDLTGLEMYKLLFLIHERGKSFSSALKEVKKDSKFDMDESLYMYRAIAYATKEILQVFNFAVTTIDRFMEYKYSDFKRICANIKEGYKYNKGKYSYLNREYIFLCFARAIYHYESEETLEKYQEKQDFSTLTKLLPFEIVGLKNVQDFMISLYPIALFFFDEDNPFISFPKDTKKIYLNENIIKQYKEMKEFFFDSHSLKNVNDLDERLAKYYDRYDLAVNIHDRDGVYFDRLEYLSSNSKELADFVYND